MSVVICRAAEYSIRRVLRCPTCKARRRMLAQTYAWYGPQVTCCHCGDTWNDGEREPRTNRRGWRQEAATKATAGWLAAGPFDRADFDRWFHEQVGELEEVA